LEEPPMVADTQAGCVRKEKRKEKKKKRKKETHESPRVIEKLKQYKPVYSVLQHLFDTFAQTS